MKKTTLLTVDIKTSDLAEVKEILGKANEKIKRYEEALREIASESCNYTYCGAEYIANEALKEWN